MLKKHFQRNSSAALLALLGCLLAYVFVAVFADSPAGGQDSWNHFLYARWGFKHPDLLLDQWGKTIFTVLAAPLAKLGVNAVTLFNIICLLISAWVVYLTARRIGMRNPWMAALLMGLQPVVLANSYSMLTEPSMALMLSLVLYLFASNRYVSATVFASFLPMARTEGYIILAAVMFFLVLRKKWKLLPLAFPGLLIYAALGALITGDWAWIYHANPYFNVGHNPMANAGKGDPFHYITLCSQIQGWVVAIMMLPSLFMLAGYVIRRFQKKSPANLFQLSLWLWWPIVLLYFGAHSYSWYKGSFGSHGLHRVFLVISPAMALLAMQSIDAIFGFQILWLNRGMKWLITIFLIFTSFPNAGMVYPWQMSQKRPSIKGDPQVELAMNLLAKYPEILKSGIISHQLPELNAKLALDPWGAEQHFHQNDASPTQIQHWPKEDKTLYLWSLGPDPATSWFPHGTWLLVDNFYSVREGGIKIESLFNCPQYELKAIENIETIKEATLNNFSSGFTVYPPLSALKNQFTASPQPDMEKLMEEFNPNSEGQVYLFLKK